MTCSSPSSDTTASAQAPTPRVDHFKGPKALVRMFNWNLHLRPELERQHTARVDGGVAKPTVMLLALLTTGAVSGYADYPQRLHRLTRPHLTAAQSMHPLARRRTCQADTARTVAFVPNRARPPQSHATDAVDEDPSARVASERRRWQLLRQPSCAAAGLSLTAVPCDALSNSLPLSSVASTDQLAVDGTFGVVVFLLVLAVASGGLIFLDSAGSSAGNESPFRNRDALAATAAAGVTAVAAALLLAAAARFY
eukprot:scaffold48947_cov75-Phaeocystis_antarctica.AAC.1